MMMMMMLTKRAVLIFLDNKKHILRTQRSRLFPNAAPSDQYERMNALNLDGTFEDRATKWGIPENMNKAELNVTLGDGGTFVFTTYLRELTDGTRWLASTMEQQTGMLSFIARRHATHRPNYRHPERTLKSFVLSEAESFSRDAKVEYCAQQPHLAAVSLQHDGVVIASPDASDGARQALAEQLQNETQAPRTSPHLRSPLRRHKPATFCTVAIGGCETPFGF